MLDLIKDAIPAKHFEIKPYRAVTLKTGFSYVENANGVNCLTFKSKAGAVSTDRGTAKIIAELWNK